jgi:hypothetical protein
MLWHIVCYKIKDWMGLKELEVRPGENRIIQFTGAGATGKTSAIKGLMYLLNGKYAIDEGVQAVNDQAERAVGELQLDSNDGKQSYTIRRVLPAGRGARPTETLYDNIAGKPVNMGPNTFLADMFAGNIAEERKKNLKLVFDPLEFVKLGAKNQVQILQELMGVDAEKDRELDNADRAAKTPINSEVKVLQTQLATLPPVVDGLPAKPVDIDAIQKKLADAGAQNQKQQAVQQKKNDLGAAAAQLGLDTERNDRLIEDQVKKIEQIKVQLKLAEDALKAAQQQQQRLIKEQLAAEKLFKDAPFPTYVDVSALAEQINAGHRTNSAIRNRARYGELRDQIAAKQAEAAKLDQQIADRKAKREQAIKKAKLPVEGIELKTVGDDDEQIFFKGLPLKNISEGEQIRVTVEILMALNPKLRAMFIQRGESLDQRGYEVLEHLAEKYNFQIWMAKLDTSGAEGYVLEEGRLKTNNYAAKKAGPKKK